jgi:hypothetical protein
LDRRTFVCALTVGLLAAPLAAEAQQAGRIPRVGVIADLPHAPNLRLETFRKGLRDLGYLEGQPVLLEIRPWDGHLGLGKLYQCAGKGEQAKEHLTTATTTYREMDMTHWQSEAGDAGTDR